MSARAGNAVYLKKLRMEAVARGLCYVCRCRVPRPGVRSCDECLARVCSLVHLHRAMSLRESAIAGGQCGDGRCGAMREQLDKTACNACLATNAARRRKVKKS